MIPHSPVRLILFKILSSNSQFLQRKIIHPFVFPFFRRRARNMDTSPTLSIGGSRARAALLTTSGTGTGSTDRRVVFLASQPAVGGGHETKTWPHHWSPHAVRVLHHSTHPAIRCTPAKTSLLEISFTLSFSLNFSRGFRFSVAIVLTRKIR